MFDILKYTRDLEESGLKRDQAEAFVRAQMHMITDNVATRADLKVLRSDMESLRSELKSDMAVLKSELKSELDSSLGKKITLSTTILGVLITTFGIFLSFS